MRPIQWLALFLGLFAVLAPGAARAEPPKPPAPVTTAVPPDSWAGQLDSLEKWLEAKKGGACTERCYTLERLALTGSVDAGSLAFELDGGVLADGPVAVPLFGPPAKVRLDGVTENGKPAAVGFEGDHYFVFTGARRFTIKGTLAMQGDLALEVVGPLNSLEADLARGRVVEGARLSGLAGTTIHFDAATKDAASVEPTVFQLSRAVRIGREINFEYRLVMRSGKDLGVARLPLKYGEKVLDVSGSTGWSVDAGDLVLPTAGSTAQITITGTLPSLASFAPDERSPYEWWLLESDAEHRMRVAGDAHQVDSSQSPIPRTQPTSRLFLVQKGEHVEVSVQALVSTEVLAAVVRNHARTVVLTNRGDLVSDDTIAYENNGIDYLLLAPEGREIYLSTDGRAERIMQQQDAGKPANGSEVLVPLLVGSHTIHGQSLTATALHPFGGTLDLPMPTYPLTASNVAVTVGLPENVHPVAVLGGDRNQWFVGWADALAVLAGAAAALVVFRTKPRRLLGALVMGGLWFLAPPAYVLALGALVASAGVWVLGRLVSKKHYPGLAFGLASLTGFVFLVLAVGTMAMRKSPSHDMATGAVNVPAAPTSVPQDELRSGEDNAREAQAKSKIPAGDFRDGSYGNFMAQQVAAGGVVQGVTPVALTLPSYDHCVTVTRELVTKDRPFKPTLVYVTTNALLPLGGAWLVAFLLLVAAHRAELVQLWRRVRARLARGPETSSGAPGQPPVPQGAPTVL